MNCLKTIAKVSPLLKISVQSLEVILDRENETYFGGESITGYCKVSLVESLDVDKIKIKFYGQAKTYLETNKSRNAIEHERLFQQFFWPKDLSPPSNLAPGLHKIAFSFIVPINIPSTFEYTDSYIKYKVKAIFGLTTKHVKVIILTNPNISISKLLLPVSIFKEKKIGLIHGRSVSLRCQLSRIGFTVGQYIPVICTIENHSDKLMTLKATLRQEIFLLAMAEHKVFYKKINTIIGPDIGPNSNFEHILKVTLPERLPIVFGTCKLIHINYILDVYLDIPRAVDLHCKMAVILTYQRLDVESVDHLLKDNRSLSTLYGSQKFPTEDRYLFEDNEDNNNSDSNIHDINIQTIPFMNTNESTRLSNLY